MFDLRQLRTFVEIAESGSFSRAADRLNTAQPALTRQMRLLEETLETRLFDRHSRGADLTEDGSAFLPRARGILREADRTLEEFQARAGTVSGPVALAVAPAMTGFLLGGLIGGYRRDFPGVRVEIVEGFTGFIEEWLIAGRVDLALLYDPRPDPRIRREALAQERLYAVGSPDRNFRPDRPVTLDFLAGMPLIAASRGQRLRDVTDAAAVQAGIELSPVIEANSLNVHKALVRDGGGATILPLGAVMAELAAGTLTAAPIAEPDITWQVALASPAFGRPSLAARALAGAIRKTVADRVATGGWPGQANG
jgi:LysR family nitrogen assimilation transcriptional regulator